MIEVLAVVGVTAAGKSALALQLAAERNGEIINTDAFQVYRGMDVGTAKLPVAERQGIPHHLLDFLDVTETATVAEFQRLARAQINDCLSRQVTPILVGGSALYTRAILDDFQIPRTDPELRAQLNAELATVGAEGLYHRLQQLAPETAAAIEPNNSRRVIRALEAIELTGGYKATLPGYQYLLPNTRQIGVRIDRETLDQRINQRVDLMWQQGFVAETQRLIPLGLRAGLTAKKALGYSQILQFLDGEISEPEAIELTKQGTRRFARRQESWWRRDPRIEWL